MSSSPLKKLCATACLSSSAATRWAAVAIQLAFVAHWAGAAETKIQIQLDEQTMVTRVSIEAQHGRVAWSDVMRALARAKGFDDSALEGVLPSGSFDVVKLKSKLLIKAMDLALKPNLRLRIRAPKTAGGEPALDISIDRLAMLSTKRRFKLILRNALTKTVKRRKASGLDLPDNLDKLPEGKPLVLVVLGFNSREDAAKGLIDSMQKAGLTCATFSYPNDQPIAESAKLFSRALKKLARKHPTRQVALVAYSMGGLVSREVIENPQFDPGNVRQLIMLATPNQGSLLANFAFGFDLWEHVVQTKDKEASKRLFASIEDGLAEASDDLRPGSPFLRQLNERQRNQKVRYTLFLGTGAPLKPLHLASIRKAVSLAGSRNRYVRFLGPRADEILGDLDEVVSGKGDGAVSLKRGRLRGVKDVVTAPFTHLNVLGRPDRPEVKKVHAAIIQRLLGKPAG